MALGLVPVEAKGIEGVPERLGGLVRLATNLRWTWTPSARELFEELSPGSSLSRLGPIQILAEERDWGVWEHDAAFVSRVEAEIAGLDAYLAGEDGSWYGQEPGPGLIAYFCAEYAVHESMGHYAGGLGILAGDHCKEASDLGIPLVGVGLFYRRGFFRQMIDWEGRQEHLYQVFEPEEWPVERVIGADGAPLRLEMELPGRVLHLAVWRMAVGRVPVILLDSNLPENRAADRPITSQVYTNGREMRFCQEMVLGVGGVRALTALELKPDVWHLNEGHSAMLLLERMRELVMGGMSPSKARSSVTANSILTIHTPIPEGNERFDASLTKSLIEPIADGSGLKVDEVLEQGLGADGDPDVFDMTAFALRHTKVSNGVSKLHGETANRTWQPVTGHRVLAVTNGVHMPTWLGPEMAALFERVGGLVAGFGMPLEGDWRAVDGLTDSELWSAHLTQKRRLIELARERLMAQHARHGEGPSELERFVDWLDPDALLIGFARRFATYKRAGLLFSDRRRAQKLFGAPGRKVQILFAGKSHPSDRGGQKLIGKVYASTVSRAFKGEAFVLEDYDMEIGRMLVQGADLWLNNPRRPLEASGTSGMKAAANGVPNASILDGWWDEAYVAGERRNGWAIGTRETVADLKEQDKADALSLYEVLEKEVVPMFFARDEAGIPREWVAVMKRSIATSAFAFSTGRMWRDYLAVFPQP